VLIRAKTEADATACLDLLLRVHERDGYPLHIGPEDVPEFFLSGREVAAWVAELDGRIVGHVALHWTPGYPTLAVAQRAIGRPAEDLLLVSRLFVASDLRGDRVGPRPPPAGNRPRAVTRTESGA
jgi:hypothetical protein